MSIQDFSKEDLLEIYVGCCVIEETVSILITYDLNKKRKTHLTEMTNIDIPEKIKKIKRHYGGTLKDDFMDLIKGKATKCKEKIDILYSKVHGEYRRMQLTNYILQVLDTFTYQKVFKILYFLILVYPIIPSVSDIITETIKIKTLYENLYLIDGSMNETIKSIATQTFAENYRVLDGLSLRNLPDNEAFEMFLTSSMEVVSQFGNTIPTDSQILHSGFIPMRVAEHLLWSCSVLCLFIFPLYLLIDALLDAPFPNYQTPLIDSFLNLLDRLTNHKYLILDKYILIKDERVYSDELELKKKELLDSIRLAQTKIHAVDGAWIKTNLLMIPRDLKHVIVEKLTGTQEQLLDEETQKAFDTITSQQ